MDVSHRQWLNYLDQSALHVASVGGFDSRVRETLPSTHRVEEELVGGESGVEAVSDEALGRGGS